MSRHAYLILAHDNFRTLSLLIKAIDDERNEVFVHFDKKVKELPSLSTTKARLHILPDAERIDVAWADSTMLEAEYKLFEAATAKGRFDRYHLVSGADLPIKSQDYIHDFFALYSDKEFIGYNQSDYSKEVCRKVQRWHLFPHDFRPRAGISHKVKRIARAMAIRVQELLHIKRNKAVNFRKGTQWVSLTHSFLEYVISKKADVMRTYSHTFCADEIFIQTLCYNSPFKANIFDTKHEGRGCMREIGWKNNRIEDYTIKDFDRIMLSTYIFARKFNDRHADVAEKILSSVI